MLCLRGLDRKSYAERLAGNLPQIPCPDPNCRGCSLRGHGWYRRFVDGVRTAIRRLRCHVCGVTHALLPEDVCAYRDLALGDLEAALAAGGGPSAAARAAGQLSAAGVRRARRWHRALSSSRVQDLWVLLATELGDFWERAQAAEGPPPGTLLRLRHRLWSTQSYFFSGLTGLFRHGRPGAVFRSSTHLGISPSPA